MPLLFIIFLAIPIIEIGLFIQVGGLIGLWPTLAIVVLTALAGTFLLRQQGLATLARLQESLARLRDPSQPLAEGAMILFAGALLLTPGFFTDASGLALMIPGVRAAIYRSVRRRVVSSNVHMQAHSYDFEARPPQNAPSDPVIDADFEEIPPKSDRDTPSGWTRH